MKTDLLPEIDDESKQAGQGLSITALLHTMVDFSRADVLTSWVLTIAGTLCLLFILTRPPAAAANAEKKQKSKMQLLF